MNIKNQMIAAATVASTMFGQTSCTEKNSLIGESDAATPTEKVVDTTKGQALDTLIQMYPEGSTTTWNEWTTGDNTTIDLSQYMQYTSDKPVNGSESKRTAKEGSDYEYFDGGKGFEIFTDSETDLSAVDVLKQQKINYNVTKVNMWGEALTIKIAKLIKNKFPNVNKVYAPYINDNADKKLAMFLSEKNITWTNTGYLTYLNQSQEQKEKNLTALLNELQWGGGENHEMMLKDSPITQQQNETQLSYNSKMPHNNKTQQWHKKTQYYRKVA